MKFASLMGSSICELLNLFGKVNFTQQLIGWLSYSVRPWEQVLWHWLECSLLQKALRSSTPSTLLVYSAVELKSNTEAAAIKTHLGSTNTISPEPKTRIVQTAVHEKHGLHTVCISMSCLNIVNANVTVKMACRLTICFLYRPSGSLLQRPLFKTDLTGKALLCLLPTWIT